MLIAHRKNAICNLPRYILMLLEFEIGQRWPEAVMHKGSITRTRTFRQNKPAGHALYFDHLVERFSEIV